MITQKAPFVAPAASSSKGKNTTEFPRATRATENAH